MPTVKPAGIEIFNQYSAIMNKCRKEIITQSWFQENWWLNVSFNGSGFNFQLSKTTWHNHYGQGIHFEFWLGEPEDRHKSLPLVLHFEPDTPNRKALGERFKQAFSGIEGDFADYRINHRAICDKMQKEERFTRSGLPRLIVQEFSRLQEIAPIIDEILASEIE